MVFFPLLNELINQNAIDNYIVVIDPHQYLLKKSLKIWFPIGNKCVV